MASLMSTIVLQQIISEPRRGRPFNKVKALCVLFLLLNSQCHKGEINGFWKRT